MLSKEISAYALNDMLLIQTVICINFLHINTKNQNMISSHDRKIMNNDDPGALTMPPNNIWVAYARNHLLNNLNIDKLDNNDIYL